MSLLPFFLAGCAPESFQFLGGKEGYWGDDYYFNDDGSGNGNNNGSGQSSSQGSSGDAHGGSGGQGNDAVTFDENSTPKSGFLLIKSYFL